MWGGPEKRQGLHRGYPQVNITTIRICFFDERVRSLMSRTAITLKFKLRWFPEEAGYSAEKGYTDITYLECVD